MFSACLRGLERARGELLRKVVEQGGRIALGVLVIAIGFGVVGATLGMAGAAAAAAVAVGYTLWRALPRRGLSWRPTCSRQPPRVSTAAS
jgi:O-antigen/teichoic acid export membrane protein